MRSRKILERFENTGDYSIYDPAVLNLQPENFGETPKSQKSENEVEDHR